jgi:peptide subunit release factor 1 (eRF1)
VVVDQAGALDLIDQLRVAVPEEIRQAKRINQEAERILEKAQEEADRMVARAQEQAAFLIEERELTRAAEIRSREIIAEGETDADEVRRGADEYAASVLIKLEGECVKALQSIRRGLATLDERRGPPDAGGMVAEPAPVQQGYEPTQPYQPAAPYGAGAPSPIQGTNPYPAAFPYQQAYDQPHEVQQDAPTQDARL